MKNLAEYGVCEQWRTVLDTVFAEPYMRDVMTFTNGERAQGKTIFPAEENVFRAFAETPLDTVKIVILGQDPYHGMGQAQGLSFSVPEGVRIPPSLRNIFKEIELEYGQNPGPTGDLTRWARQGVMLLNATLTVEEGKAGSHQKKGWEKFTDTVIRIINDKADHVVFMLWGAYAQQKKSLINQNRHLVLEAPHPSPLSAHRGFLGCNHFRDANEYLTRHGRTPVDWLKTNA